MLEAKDGLEGLVESVRRPTDRIGAGGWGELADAPDFSWFPDLVERSERAAEVRQPEHQELWDRANRWSRWITDSKSREQTENLVQAHVVAHLVNEGSIDHPLECAKAPITGDADPLRTPGQGVMVAFLHTGIASVLFNAPVAAAGRAVFMPGGQASPERFAQSLERPESGPTVRANAERLGIRFVGPERRFEVYSRLLELGEVCMLPLDAPGHAPGRLLGQNVRTTTAPVRLARSTGSPLLVAASFWTRRGFELRLSPPLNPSSFEADDALHSEMLRIADEWLAPQPEQFLIRFPSVAFWEALRRQDRLRASFADARSVELEARERVRRIEAMITTSPDPDQTPIPDPRAGQQLKAARHSLKQARAARQLAETAFRKAREDVRR